MKLPLLFSYKICFWGGRWLQAGGAANQQSPNSFFSTNNYLEMLQRRKLENAYQQLGQFSGKSHQNASRNPESSIMNVMSWLFPTGSTSSSTRASPANTVRGGSVGARPAASNISLDDITSQLEKASLSMDEAARQTSSSSSSTSSVSSTTLRRPSSGSSGGVQHRRTGSVGAVSEQEAASQRSSVNSACASASSMDSLDTDKALMGGEAEGQSSPGTQGQNQTSTEVWLTVKYTETQKVLTKDIQEVAIQ